MQYKHLNSRGLFSFIHLLRYAFQKHYVFHVLELLQLYVGNDYVNIVNIDNETLLIYFRIEI